MNRHKSKEYSSMSAAKLDAIVAKFDRSMIVRESKPLTPRMTAQDRAARRGRPRVGRGAEKIRISVERDLLHQADALAHKKGMTRSQLIARGLQAALLLAG